MTISHATSDDQLQAVRALFEATFSDIAPDAVPYTAEGHSTYDVMVVQALDADGLLQGAAMTNRAQIAVQSMMMGDPLSYASVIDKHRELDLLAVRPNARGSGIGTQLLEFVEDRLAATGIDVLFGNATSDLDIVKLRPFYERHGYTVHPSGDPLPKLLGKPWTHPMAPPAAFYFHKMLNSGPIPRSEQAPRRSCHQTRTRRVGQRSQRRPRSAGDPDTSGVARGRRTAARSARSISAGSAAVPGQPPPGEFLESCLICRAGHLA